MSTLLDPQHFHNEVGHEYDTRKTLSKGKLYNTARLATIRLMFPPLDCVCIKWCILRYKPFIQLVAAFALEKR